MLRAFFGHHKCGSTWTSLILADLARRANLKLITHSDNTDLGNNPNNVFDGKDYGMWFHGNANWNVVGKVNTRAIHVVRDPRDVIISGYYSHLYSHPTKGLPALIKLREDLSKVDKTDGLYLEMDFAKFYMDDMLSFSEASAHENVLTVCYEQMVANELLSFQSIAKHLDLSPKPIAPNQLRDVVNANSFKQLAKGRNKGEEDAKSPFRKGIAGDWVNHFNVDHKKYFKDRYQPLLALYGYEQDENW